MSSKLPNGLRDQIREYSGLTLELKLKPWLERKFSTPKIVTELSIAAFMKFKAELSMDTSPIRRDGQPTKIMAVDDMTKVQGAIFKELDTHLMGHTHEDWEAPARRLAHREPPVLEGAFAPEVARRTDLMVSPTQQRAMQLLTNKPWVINQFNWEVIKGYRESLGENDRDRIFYDHEEEAMAAMLHGEESSGDKLECLFDRIEDQIFYLAVRRMDEAGRMYADPLHPMYSRFLRAIIQSPPEKLTEQGWAFLRKHIAEAYGHDDDSKRDAWAARWKQDHLLLMQEKDKKGADELACAMGWLEARETGATGYGVHLDFVAQGMGLLAAIEGCSWHHQLVNIKDPKFVSAHDRFTIGLKEEERNFMIHSYSALKPISKGVITPVMYSGGGHAVAAMLSNMEKDVFGEWNWGEHGDKLPEINPILLEMIGEDLSPSQQMKAMERLGKKFARICKHKFPFLRKYQEDVRRVWVNHLNNETTPVYRGPDGYEFHASPFTTNKKATVAIRCSRFDEHGKRTVQPRTSCHPHTIDASGTSMCAKIAFMLDRLIACWIIIYFNEATGSHVSSIHDAFSAHPNYGYLLESICTKAYNKVLGEYCESIGRDYNPLPDDAILVRA